MGGNSAEYLIHGDRQIGHCPSRTAKKVVNCCSSVLPVLPRELSIDILVF
jgi:hypothetical protein